MIKIMVEKTKSVVQTTVQVPVWVFLLMVPIFITLLQVIVNQTNAQVKLQTETEVNKTQIEVLRTTKADAALFSRFENSLNRIEIKLDNYINKDTP
jgi:hypothetical protein